MLFRPRISLPSPQTIPTSHAINSPIPTATVLNHHHHAKSSAAKHPIHAKEITPHRNFLVLTRINSPHHNLHQCNDATNLLNSPDSVQHRH